MDSIPESPNPLGQPIDRRVPPCIDVAHSHLVIRFLAREHVQGTNHDGVGHRHDRTLLAPTRRQASIQGARNLSPFVARQRWLRS
jgi:hypothetical protein